MRVMRASLIYVLTCQKHANFLFLRANVPINVPTCQRASVPKVCQFFNLACERAKSVLIFQLGVPTCQRRVSFSTWRAMFQKVCQLSNFAYQKAFQFFNYFSKENIFNFWIFLIMVKGTLMQIWKSPYMFVFI